MSNIPEKDLHSLVIGIMSEVYSENDFEGKPITTEIIAELMYACIKKGLMHKIQREAG